MYIKMFFVFDSQGKISLYRSTHPFLREVAWLQNQVLLLCYRFFMDGQKDVQLDSLGHIARKVGENQWLPLKVDEGRQKREGSSKQNIDDGQRHQRQAEFTMALLVREALVNASKARADEEFAVSLARLQNLGLDIGDKYASRSFVRVVEHSGAKMMEFLQAESLLHKLPGLGILSPMSLTFDSVSVGDAMFARNETFQIICCTVLDSISGELVTHFLSCPSIGMNHDGASQAAGVLEALRTHASNITLQSLRRRCLTMVGGDGAVAKGGVRQKHTSTEACNRLAEFLGAMFVVSYLSCFCFYFNWTPLFYFLVIFNFSRALIQHDAV